MKNLLLIIISMVLFYGCAEHCEPFPKEYKNFTPYEKSDVLCFENTKGENIAFEVMELYANEGDKKIPWGCKCVCTSRLSYKIHSPRNNCTIRIFSDYIDNDRWDCLCEIIDSTNDIVSYVKSVNEKISDTLFLYPSKVSKVKGTIKLVKGVGLVNLFIDDEEYLLKNE